MGEVTGAHMLCADGFNTVFCLIDHELWELEGVEIPEWLERFDEIVEQSQA